MGLGMGAWAMGRAMQDMARGSTSTRDWRNARMDAAWDRAGEAREPVGEDLACPVCRQRYSFGDGCPDCEVRLVSVSLVDSVVPEADFPPRHSLEDALFAVAGLATAVGLVVGFFELLAR